MIRVQIHGGVDQHAQYEGSGAIAIVKVSPRSYTVGVRGLDSEDLAHAFIAFADALIKMDPGIPDRAEEIAEKLDYGPLPSFIIDHGRGGTRG